MTKKWPYLPAMRDVREGTILEADDGFTCIPNGARRKVFRDTDPKRSDFNGRYDRTVKEPMNSRGRLYIRCSEGRHYLDGQECSAGEHGINHDHYAGLKVVSQRPKLAPRVFGK